VCVPVPVVYLEAVGSRSPGSAGFALDQGRASLSYYVNPLQAPLSDVLTDILGGTEYDKSDGRLKRKLPRAHPLHAWLYAERVSNMQGVGRPITFAVTESYEAPVLVPKIALYRKYLLTVEFVARPYTLVSDDNIPVYAQVWIDETGASVNATLTREYVRFTDYDVLPDTDLITAQHGQMVFRTGVGGPDGKTMQGLPRVTIPKALIKFRWFGIPFRYVESPDSYLTRYLNYINQLDFWNWPAGSLLYRGFQVMRRYPAVVPDTNPVFGTTAYTPDKFCDVELYWEYTRRECASPPAPPSNGNWLPLGHNLMPHYIDRKFYYVTTKEAGVTVDPDQQVPTYLSFPLQLLFTDPDV
jgi:hypothetical protein